MTIEQAKAFIAKYPAAISFVRPSHLEELSPLYEVHIEAVTAQKFDFHELTGGVYYPRKETTDRFGNAAGISFAGVAVNTRTEDGAYVGRAFPQELGPDGKMIQWAPAEYEFDPETRAEIDILTAEKKGKKKDEIEKKLVKLNYKKVGRRRADTGARAAAIISAIGMPTGFPRLFSNSDEGKTERTFLFSRVIVNSKNEMVLQKALDSMFSTAGALYGPQVVAQITGETETPAPAGIRNVTPEADGFETAEASAIDITSAPEVEENESWCAVLEYESAYDLSPTAAAELEKARASDLQTLSDEYFADLLRRIGKWCDENPGARR